MRQEVPFLESHRWLKDTRAKLVNTAPHEISSTALQKQRESGSAEERDESGGGERNYFPDPITSIFHKPAVLLREGMRHSRRERVCLSKNTQGQEVHQLKTLYYIYIYILSQYCYLFDKLYIYIIYYIYYLLNKYNIYMYILFIK